MPSNFGTLHLQIPLKITYFLKPACKKQRGLALQDYVTVWLVDNLLKTIDAVTKFSFTHHSHCQLYTMEIFKALFQFLVTVQPLLNSVQLTWQYSVLITTNTICFCNLLSLFDLLHPSYVIHPDKILFSILRSNPCSLNCSGCLDEGFIL